MALTTSILGHRIIGSKSEEFGCGTIAVLFLAKYSQATMCEQRRYHSAKATFCSSTSLTVSGGLLRENCEYFQVIFRTTLWKELVIHDALAIEENCGQIFHVHCFFGCGSSSNFHWDN